MKSWITGLEIKGGRITLVADSMKEPVRERVLS
jgi:hypothetical protein